MNELSFYYTNSKPDKETNNYTDSLGGFVSLTEFKNNLKNNLFADLCLADLPAFSIRCFTVKPLTPITNFVLWCNKNELFDTFVTAKLNSIPKIKKGEEPYFLDFVAIDCQNNYTDYVFKPNSIIEADKIIFEPDVQFYNIYLTAEEFVDYCTTQLKVLNFSYQKINSNTLRIIDNDVIYKPKKYEIIFVSTNTVNDFIQKIDFFSGVDNSQMLIDSLSTNQLLTVYLKTVFNKTAIQQKFPNLNDATLQAYFNTLGWNDQTNTTFNNLPKIDMQQNLDFALHLKYNV
jgi:hypothetical protein